MDTDEWRGRVDGRLEAIETRLIAVETSNAVEEVHRNNVERRLGGIEETLKWLTRLIIGGIVTGIIGGVLAYLFGSGIAG